MEVPTNMKFSLFDNLMFIFFSLLLLSSLHTAQSAGLLRVGTNSSSRSNTNVGKKRLTKLSTNIGGIRWDNLSVYLPKRKKLFGFLQKKEKKKCNGRYLLHPNSGFVENGQVCAIIGPSGAGKSTLLAALSGTTLKGSGKVVFGSIWMENVKIDDNEDIEISKSDLSMHDGHIALLTQTDTFFSMLTPRETLYLATYLQLNLNKVEREILIDDTLDKLGLRHVESRQIGSPIIGDSGSISGGSLSGGERRRLSVALELVNSPKVLLADEPTTGLDSSQAQKVFKVLKKSAKDRNIPCICTIHQPRASIWQEVDSFVLMAPGGKVVYSGKRKDAIGYFASMGYRCPPATTASEFFVDLVTIDTEDEEMASIDKSRIEFLATAFSKQQLEEQKSKGQNLIQQDGDNNNLGSRKLRRSFLRRFGALLRRAFRQNFRDFKVNLIRAVASFGLAGLFSELFSNVKKGSSLAKSVADRTALLSFGVINMAMLSLMKTLNLFGKERAVISREQMRRQYSSFEYLLSKSIGEIPLDVIYSVFFATALKHFTCLRIPLALLCGTFSLMTVATSSIGFAVGSYTSGVEEAMTTGMPLMVILMAVGVINPSGVDITKKQPFIIRLLKRMSPISIAIEALCIAEYDGMDFSEDGMQWSWKDLPRMGGLAFVRNGDQVIEALGLSNKSYSGMMKSMFVLSISNLIMSWIGLTFCGTQFIKANDSS